MTIHDTRSPSPLLEVLFEDHLVGRCLVAPDGSVLRANEVWLRSTGYSLDAVLGASIIDLFPGTRDMALSLHARARAGHRVEVSRHAQFVNGRETWWEGSIDPVPMDGGIGLLITGREVGPAVDLPRGPERRQEPDGLDPVWLRALLNSVPDDVFFLDTGGNVVFVNDAVRTSLGVSDLGAVRKRLHETEAMFEIYTTDGRRRRSDESPFIEAFQGRPVEGEEVVRNAKTGVLRHRRYRVAPVRLDGKIIGVVSVVRDVTELWRASQELAEKEARLRLALDAAQMVAWDFDPATKGVTMSEPVASLIGRPRATGDERIPPIHPDDVAAHCRKVIEATQHAGTYVSEFRRVCDNGEVIWLEERGRGVMDGFGRTARLVGVTQNITARKRDAERLEETTGRLLAALDAAALGTFAFDPETGKVLWDAQQKRIWGLSPEAEVDFPSILARVHPEDREVTARAFELALGPSSDGRWEAVYRIIRPDGEVRWLRANGRVVCRGGGADRRAVRIIGVEADVTASRLQEERLLDSTHRLTVATEVSHLGIHDYNVASGALCCDARVRELWGVGPDEPFTYETFVSGLHPDDRAATQAAVDGALDPQGDGTYWAEYRVINRRDGGERWIAATGKVTFVGGKPTRLIGAVQDITDYRRVQNLLREADRSNT